MDTIWISKSEAKTARRMEQSFKLTNGVLKQNRNIWLQADGSYLYSRSVVLTESGTWTPPDGVTHLRVAIGQGGQGGMRGQDGWIEKGERNETLYYADYGEDGDSGLGGKVWHGTIAINPGLPIAVHIGEGGAASTAYGTPGAEGGETTFGAYSSASGQRYTNGFTDINSGASYARTGVAVPVVGTSDGGAGGSGGDPGQGEWRQADWHYDDGSYGGRYWYFRVTKAPGDGSPGAAGASGFVMISWDIEEETG